MAQCIQTKGWKRMRQSSYEARASHEALHHLQPLRRQHQHQQGSPVDRQVVEDTTRKQMIASARGGAKTSTIVAVTSKTRVVLRCRFVLHGVATRSSTNT